MPRPVGTTNTPDPPEDERDPVARAFGAFLAAVRIQNNIPQRTLAKVMGTVQSHVSEMETGHQVPNVATAVRYLVSVGVAVGRAEQKVHRPR